MIDLSPLFGDPREGELEEVSFRVFPKTGLERWLLESRYWQPWHLKTWPRANLRGRLIYRGAWFLAMLGIHLPSRVERFPVSERSAYAQIRAEFDHIGVFLGTPGPNRKVVVFADQPGRSVFVKIPLGQASIELVQNETAALSELAREPELAGIIPAHEFVAGHLAVENLETNGAGYGALGLAEVSRIHSLLEKRSRFDLRLSQARRNWESCAGCVPTDHDAATLETIAATRNAAQCFLNGLPQNMLISCYMAHGDFTRWNVLRAADGSARVIDWELYGPRPLYFDLIHYFVSHDLLVKRMGSEEILSSLVGIGEKLGNPDFWELHVGLYFSFQALFYSSVYERQISLHAQAHWQLKTWAKILHHLSRKRCGPK